MISRRRVVAGLGAGLALPWFAGNAAAADAPVVVPIALSGGRIIVATGVNGKGPFFFTIDSGGTMSLIADSFARKIGLPAIDQHKIRGLNGEASSAVYQVHDLLLGGSLRQREVAFHGVDFMLGKDIVGSLAAGAVTSYDSVLDFDRGEWRVYPHGLPDLAGFTAIDSRVAHPSRDGRGSSYIYATIALDGQPFNCLLDTGTPGALILHPEAARRTRLWSDPATPYAPVRLNGIGGRGAVSRVARARQLTIGPMTVEAPLVELEGGMPGRFDVDGIVGLEVLRQMNLAIDTHGRRLLVRNNGVRPPPQRAPTSGLWVDHDGDDLVIADVGRGSPAATAGIAAGDRIVDTGFAKLLHALGSGPGVSVALTIEHQGQRRRVTIVLADYL